MALRTKTLSLLERASGSTLLMPVPMALEGLLRLAKKETPLCLREALSNGFRLVLDGSILLDERLGHHLETIDRHVRDGTVERSQIVVPSVVFEQFCRVRAHAKRRGQHSPAHSAALRRIESWQCQGVLEMPDVVAGAGLDSAILDLCQRLNTKNVALLTNNRALRIKAREVIPDLVVLL